MRSAIKLGWTALALMLVAPMAVAQGAGQALSSAVTELKAAPATYKPGTPPPTAAQATNTPRTPQGTAKSPTAPAKAPLVTAKPSTPSTKTPQAATKSPAPPAKAPLATAKPSTATASAPQAKGKVPLAPTKPPMQAAKPQTLPKAVAPAVKAPQVSLPLKAKRPVTKKPSAIAAKPEPKSAPAPELAAGTATRLPERGARDPFVSIIHTRAVSDPNCTTGKKCLQVAQIVLRGIVRGPNGMMAVVENRERKSYFLRENDPVYNGQVVRITGDSIIFREKFYDRLGREKSREVVKRVPGSKPA